MTQFPSPDRILEIVNEIIRKTEENLYRLPRVVVLRQLAERNDLFFHALLRDQGNSSRNIVHDISEHDQDNIYWLVNLNWYEDEPGAVLGTAELWIEGAQHDRKAYSDAR